MRFFLLVISILLVIILEMSVLPAFKIWGGIPSLALLLFLLFYGFEKKRTAWLVSGIALTFLDLFKAPFFGFSFLFLLLLFCFLEYIKKRFFEEYTLIHLSFISVLATLFYHFSLLLIYVVLRKDTFYIESINSVFSGALWSFFLFLFLYFVFFQIEEFLQKNQYFKIF